MTETPESPVPTPVTEDRDERDWEERRRVALEAWRLGQKLAGEQRQGKVAIGRRAYRPRRTAAK